jgi:hypothetical protein
MVTGQGQRLAHMAPGSPLALRLEDRVGQVSWMECSGVVCGWGWQTHSRYLDEFLTVLFHELQFSGDIAWRTGRQTLMSQETQV